MAKAKDMLNYTDAQLEAEAMLHFEQYCRRMAKSTLLHKEARECYGKLADKVEAIRRLRYA